MITTVTEMKACDVMVVNPVCVEPQTTIQQLVRVFAENDISSTPVVNRNHMLIGVVSQTDLIRNVSAGVASIPSIRRFELIGVRTDERITDDAAHIPEPPVCAEDLMTQNLVAVMPKTPVILVARLLCDLHIHLVFVVNERMNPVGTITSTDLLNVHPCRYTRNRPRRMATSVDCDAFVNEWSFAPRHSKGVPLEQSQEPQQALQCDSN